MFQNEEALNIHESPFPNHHINKVRGEVLIVSGSERDVEGDISMQPEGVTDLDRMVQRLQSLFKFKKKL